MLTSNKQLVPYGYSSVIVTFFLVLPLFNFLPKCQHFLQNTSYTIVKEKQIQQYHYYILLIQQIKQSKKINVQLDNRSTGTEDLETVKSKSSNIKLSHSNEETAVTPFI